MNNHAVIPCLARECRTAAIPVHLPRWQVINCRVDVNSDLPNDHKDNIAQFRKLKVKPDQTQEFHGYFEKPVLGSAGRPERPHFNKRSRKTYRLRGYVSCRARTTECTTVMYCTSAFCPFGQLSWLRFKLYKGPMNKGQTNAIDYARTSPTTTSVWCLPSTCQHPFSAGPSVPSAVP